VDVGALRAEHAAIVALTTPESRALRLAALEARAAAPRRTDLGAAEIIASLDARGAWVADGLNPPQAGAPLEKDERVTVRGISTATFVSRMSSLIAFLRENR
ncbi:MAG TPA: hypothetical protein VLN08_12315, partial [Vicinamibacterales bacterium]|nr:hypothetical protein [Vicinamibacterales bacterium]